MVKNAVFRMPLYGQGKLLTAGHRDGFNQTIWRPGFHLQARAQTINTLSMHGVDHLCAGAGNGGKDTIGFNGDSVGQRILNIQRCRFIFPMIHKLSNFMHSLMKCAAIGNIHFLQTATNRQHRHTLRHGLGNQ